MFYQWGLWRKWLPGAILLGEIRKEREREREGEIRGEEEGR